MKTKIKFTLAALAIASLAFGLGALSNPIANQIRLEQNVWNAIYVQLNIMPLTGDNDYDLQWREAAGYTHGREDQARADADLIESF